MVHCLARTGRITLADRFYDVAVLASRHFTVVSDIDRGKHDALHLAANIFHGADQQPVVSQLRNAEVELGIGFNEIFITLAICSFILSLRNFREALDQSAVCPAASRKFGTKPLQFGAVLVHFIQFMNGEMADKISLLGYKSQQAFLLQAHDGLTHGRAAALISMSQDFFVDRFSGLEHAVNNVGFKLLIDLLRQRWDTWRNG